MLDFVGVATPLSGPALVEFRAYYGGLELGFALYLQYCARHADFARPGLLAATSIFAGCAVVRGLAMTVSSCYSWPNAASFLGEAAFAVMTAIILRRSDRPAEGKVSSRSRSISD